MANKILICYSFKNINPGQRKQFDRKLFGTVEKTHRGKYETKIKGILTNKEYRKPVKSVIIVDKKYLKKITTVLDEFSANREIYEITPI